VGLAALVSAVFLLVVAVSVGMVLTLNYVGYEAIPQGLHQHVFRRSTPSRAGPPVQTRTREHELVVFEVEKERGSEHG